jgi:hypothetical protein
MHARPGLAGRWQSRRDDVPAVRYFGLRSFSTLYGLTWTAYALAGAVAMIMGRAFDMTGSYESLLGVLALLVSGVAVLMLLLPAYDSPVFRARAVLATTTVNPPT